MKKKRIAIFASGSGSNAENIVRFFKDNSLAEVVLILSNNPDAYVLERAEKMKVPAFIFNRSDLYENEKVIDVLKSKNIDIIVLAGFLWLIPKAIISAYPRRIVNIHPALLPKYGGKGMYGLKVHEKVIAEGDTESGITIHFVNENYDEGDFIFQGRCLVSRDDNAETLANKIHELEYKYYPEVIERIIEGWGE